MNVQRTNEASPDERERCARHCEVLASFLERGAGDYPPGARLRQAARHIREGKPATLWLDEHGVECPDNPESLFYACQLCGDGIASSGLCPKCSRAWGEGVAYAERKSRPETAVPSPHARLLCLAQDARNLAFEMGLFDLGSKLEHIVLCIADAPPTGSEPR